MWGKYFRDAAKRRDDFFSDEACYLTVPDKYRIRKITKNSGITTYIAEKLSHLSGTGKPVYHKVRVKYSNKSLEEAVCALDTQAEKDNQNEVIREEIIKYS